MITYQTYCQIKAGQREGFSARKVAGELGLHEETVGLWFARDQYRPSAGAARQRASKLDAFKGAIARRLESHPYSARQLFQKLREEGYAGGYSILKEYVRQVRPRPTPAFLTLKFAPGQSAQVDWGSHGSVRVGQSRRALSFFVLVLCHSRWLHVEFTLGQSQEWFLAAHQRAFERLGAVPREIIVDNCKTAVLSHPPGQAPVFNPRYLDFARHYGFEIRACAARHPQSKGIVENAVAYVKKNLLAGLEAPEFASLGAACTQWLDAVANVREHAQTHRRPVDLLRGEKEHLLPLCPNPYPATLIRPVRASCRCRVAVDAVRYSVPPEHAGQMLTLHLSREHVRLYAQDRLVAEHPRAFERGLDVEHPDHVRDLLEQRTQARRQRLLLRFLALSPHAPTYHAKLLERRLNGPHHVEKIVALAEIHGPEPVARAIADACELGAYSCEYIANILEQHRRRLPEPGALHLTRSSDLLDLELEPPNLAPYGRDDSTTTPQPPRP